MWHASFLPTFMKKRALVARVLCLVLVYTWLWLKPIRYDLSWLLPIIKFYENICLSSRLDEEKIFTAPPRRRRAKKIAVPLRRGKKEIPFRPAEGKNIYRSVPPREKIFTVPSHRGVQKRIPSRPVAKLCHIEFNRPVPSINLAPAVPSRPVPPKLFFLVCCRSVPSRCQLFFPPWFSVTRYCDKPSKCQTK